MSCDFHVSTYVRARVVVVSPLCDWLSSVHNIILYHRVSVQQLQYLVLTDLAADCSSVPLETIMLIITVQMGIALLVLMLVAVILCAWQRRTGKRVQRSPDHREEFYPLPSYEESINTTFIDRGPAETTPTPTPTETTPTTTETTPTITETTPTNTETTPTTTETTFNF